MGPQLLHRGHVLLNRHCLSIRSSSATQQDHVEHAHSDQSASNLAVNSMSVNLLGAECQGSTALSAWHLDGHTLRLGVRDSAHSGPQGLMSTSSPRGANEPQRANSALSGDVLSLEVSTCSASLSTRGTTSSHGNVQIVSSLVPQRHRSNVDVIVGQDVHVARTTAKNKRTHTTQRSSSGQSAVLGDQLSALAVESQTQLASFAPRLVESKGDSVALGVNPHFDVVERRSASSSRAESVDHVDSVAIGDFVAEEDKLSGVLEILGVAAEVDHVRIAPRHAGGPFLSESLRSK